MQPPYPPYPPQGQQGPPQQQQQQQQQPNFYAPPQGQIQQGQWEGAGAAIPYGYGSLEAGGFGIRVAARIIDEVALILIAVVAGVIGAMVVAILAALGMVRAGWEQRIGESGVGSMAVSMLISIVYFTLADGLGGASLGKLICGLRVICVDDQRPCTFGKGLKRSFAYLLDAQFFGLIGYTSMSKSPLQQRYGDKWARTAVVRARSLMDVRSKGKPAFGILIGLGLVVVADVVLGVVHGL